MTHMGHQARFYITPEDTTALEKRLSKGANAIFLHSRSMANEPRIVDSLSYKSEGNRWLFYYLTRAEDLSSVVMTHVPVQEYWNIDIFRSPVIQFNGCYSDGQVLRIGRLYYVDGFYGADDQWVYKSESFRSWAKSVLTMTKRMLRRNGTDYIGKGAEEWLASSGGKLVA